MACEECKALREALDQVDDYLVIRWITAKEGNYRKALHELVTWEIQVANDPLVSEEAAQRKAYVEKLENAILNQCADNLCWIVDPQYAKTLPESEFLESCRRYRNQITEANGELTAKTMTIAQLEARVVKLGKDLALSHLGLRGWEPDEFENQSHDLMMEVQGQIVAELEKAGFDPCHAIKIANEATETAWGIWNRFMNERIKMKGEPAAPPS